MEKGIYACNYREGLWTSIRGDRPTSARHDNGSLSHIINPQMARNKIYL